MGIVPELFKLRIYCEEAANTVGDSSIVAHSKCQRYKAQEGTVSNTDKQANWWEHNS